MRLVILLLCLCVISCQFEKETKNNILVIALDKLPSYKLQCSDKEQEVYGFQYFCEEAIRFTHAYTPSVMSQAALASFFTAKYPFEHSIWHNGRQFLTEDKITLAEVAFSRGYRTSLFTGGGVIWRRSGLAQGFEVFEENVKFDLQKYYRPAIESFKIYSLWLDSLGKEQNFFSVIYVPDLIFEKTPTYNDLGLIRESSYDGQLNEINESLNWLISDLKKRNLWDSSYVVLMGLNGVSSAQRLREFRSYDLHSENTQVALFIKPPQKKRDLGLNWKIDKNVSLVDLSYSFFQLLNHNIENNQGDELLVSKNILPSGNDPEINIPAKRPIVIESGWPQWRGLSNTRVAIRYDNYLYLNNKSPVLFNTLIDRLEAVPNYLVNEERSANLPLLKDITKKLNLEAWQGLEESEIEKLKLGKELWFNPRNTNSIKKLKALAKKKEDIQIVFWLAQAYVRNRMWQEFESLGEANGNSSWTFIARLNQGKKISDLDVEDPCLRKFFSEEIVSEKEANPRSLVKAEVCESDLLDDLYEWANGSHDVKEFYRERFLRNYRFYRIDNHLYEINYMTDLNLDFSILYPTKPEVLELILSTKKYDRMRRFIKKRVPLYPYEE